MVDTVHETCGEIDAVLARFPDAKRDALIPILQEIQAKEGFISKNALQRVSEHLDLPTSKIFGVATFYNQFRFESLGRYHIQICRGTACHVKGSAAILDTLQQELELKAGQTSRDGLFSLEVVACVGACGLAPVISINGEFFGNLTPASVRKIIKSYREKE